MSLDIASPDWQYYSVSGATLHDVASQLAHLPEAAETTWHTAYHAAPDEHGVIVDVTVTVSTVVKFPQWSDYDQACEAERHEWDRFSRALLEHEWGHIDLASTYLAGLDERMVGGTMHHAQATFDHAVETLHAASAAFDGQNDHGRNSGTIIDVDVAR
jgi:predicted secreted Zn-dependent protease